ncbi:hypothetical protein JCM9279_006663 [Rhodotorula babjevae]
MLAWSRAALRTHCCHARPLAPHRPLSTSLHLNLPPRPPAPPLVVSSRPARRTDAQHDDSPLARDSYHLASEVRRLTLLGKGDVSAALNLVRAAPADAATVVVWNVLLNSILVSSTASTATTGPTHAQAVRKAYDVWMEMKRRGITPSARGYGTVLTGVAKRAKLALDDASRGRKKAEGWNAELRAKVDIIHKQWLVHCERVLAKGDDGAGDVTGLVGLDGVEVEAAERDADDGRADTPVDLSAVPTNQYLSFLASSLSLSTLPSVDKAAPVAASAPAAGPSILKHLLQTFHSLPDADDLSQGTLSRLAKTGVSYSIMLSALRAGLQASCAAASSPSSPTPSSSADAAAPDAGWPTPTELLETALASWTHLLEHPAAPEAPLASSAAPLSPVIPTSLLALFLIPSSAVLPAALFTRALDAAQQAFGFVPPAELASLESAHGERGGASKGPSVGLAPPLCTPLDAPGLGVALRVVAASGRKDWVKGWWEQVRDYPARFGLAGEGAAEEVRGREEGEVVLRACGAAGDVEGIEDVLGYLLSPSLRLSPLHRPDLSTFTLAMTSLARIGTPAAVDASLRTWSLLLGTLDPSPSPAIKPFYAPAADCLVRCALSTRDRGQVWRAIKAVALLDPESAPSASSPFGPSAFPPAASEPRAAKAGTLALANSLALALSRVVAAPHGAQDSLAPAAVPPSRRAELEQWSARVSAWAGEAALRDAETGGGEERREGEGEMEWRRRMVALKRARTAAAGRKGPSSASAGSAARTPRADGQPQHTERRKKWWSDRQEEWAQVRAEREKTGDGRRTPRDLPRQGAGREERAPRWEGGRREDRRARFEGDQGGSRDERPGRSTYGSGQREDRPSRSFERRDDRARPDRREDRPRFERRDDRPRFPPQRRDDGDGAASARPRFDRAARPPRDERGSERSFERREDRPRRFDGRDERSGRPGREGSSRSGGGQRGWDD